MGVVRSGRVGVGVVAFVLWGVVPAAAFAQDDDAKARHFGEAGQFALSLNEGVIFNATDLFTSGDLEANYFVVPHLSVGVAIGAQWLSSSPTSTGATSTFIFHVGPRVGYDIPVAQAVSIWPQVGVDYRMLNETVPTATVTDTGNPSAPSESISNATSTSSAVGITVLAPVLIHPTRGFFLGAGPVFYADLSNNTSSQGTSTSNSKITSVGLLATIGGAI
jgi:hypothetical protein